LPCGEAHGAGDTGSRRSEELSDRTAPTPRGLRATARIRGRSATVVWRRRRGKVSTRAARPAKRDQCCGSCGGIRRSGARGRGRGIAPAKRAVAPQPRATRMRSPADEASPQLGAAPGARGPRHARPPRRVGRTPSAARQRPSGAAEELAWSNRILFLAACACANQLPAPRARDGTISMYRLDLALVGIQYSSASSFHPLGRADASGMQTGANGMRTSSTPCEANRKRIGTAKIGGRDERDPRPAIGLERAVSRPDWPVPLSQDPAKSRDFPGWSEPAAAKSLQPQTGWRWVQSRANPSLATKTPD
jgi:hypothetical protein